MFIISGQQDIIFLSGNQDEIARQKAYWTFDFILTTFTQSTCTTEEEDKNIIIN